MDENSTITLADGYRAMFCFIDSYWERGGKVDDGIATMLGSMQFGESSGRIEPLDPAQWSDWVDAVKAIKQ